MCLSALLLFKYVWKAKISSLLLLLKRHTNWHFHLYYHEEDKDATVKLLRKNATILFKKCIIWLNKRKLLKDIELNKLISRIIYAIIVTFGNSYFLLCINIVMFLRYINVRKARAIHRCSSSTISALGHACVEQEMERRRPIHAFRQQVDPGPGFPGHAQRRFVVL